MGRCGPEAVNRGPATEIPEIIRIPVPALVNVIVLVPLCPTSTSPKLTEFTDSPNTILVLPVAALLVVPTQPDVTRIAARAKMAAVP